MDETQSLSPNIQEAEILLSFPQAITEVIRGHKITRVSWNSTEEYGILADGWLTIHTKGSFHVWKVNDGDLNGMDWKVC